MDERSNDDIDVDQGRKKERKNASKRETAELISMAFDIKSQFLLLVSTLSQIAQITILSSPKKQ